MKKLIFILVLIVLAVIADLVFGLTAGNVTLWVPPYRVDLTLQAAIVSVIVLVVMLLIVGRLLGLIMSLPSRVRQFRQRRTQAARLRTLSELIVAYFEGRFARAVKSTNDLKQDQELLTDVPYAVTAANAIAASAAHQLRDMTLRDQFVTELRQSAQTDDQESLGRLLEAEFAVDDHKGGRAITALAPLTKGDRRNVHTLRILLKANQQQSNWAEVLRLTKLLENRNAIPSVVAIHYKRLIVQAWIDTSRHDQAIELIEATLKSNWDSSLAMLYGRCLGNAKDQLVKLEQWLQHHPSDPELNWSLGRVCQRQRLWGKARQHFELSLRLKPMIATHFALAEIAEALSEKETAALHWKAAATMAV
jgi:HemY protein